MDVQKVYASKLTTAKEAISKIESGWRIMGGSGCACPQTLIRELVAQADRLRDVEIVHLMTFGYADYVKREYQKSFRHCAFFIGANVRSAVREGLADYIPVFLSEIPELIRSGHKQTNAVLLQVSPPDRHGYCSLGVSIDIQKAGLEAAELVIAEVNPQMPRTFGNSNVHLSQIDCLVESNEPLLELKSADEIDPISMEIGEHVARLVEHGSCLQLGIGSIPNAVLRFLTHKRHLGVHTEMFSDGILPLVENGNIDNSRKKLLPGKVVTSFVMGSRKLYDFVNDNPSVEFHTSDFVNDPRNISQNDNVVAVNSALQVDLTGQVCADSLGYTFYSGIGGQVDFIRGASMSKGGKPIIALSSTAKNGTISRIVPHLDEGAGVVTSRGDVHYVVTEWGVAYLHGKTIRERALALINVTHPDFRKEMFNFVRERHFVHLNDVAWEHVKNPYPSEWEEKKKFGGKSHLIRPIRATDERLLQEFFYSHEPSTVYARYFTMKESLGHQEAAQLCCIDYNERMAFGIFEVSGTAERFVAVGRYDLNPRTNFARTWVVVSEDKRRMGMAQHLLELLTRYAKERGVAGFSNRVIPESDAVLSVHRKMGHDVRWDETDQIFVVEARFT